MDANSVAKAKEALKKLIDTYNKFKDDKSFLSNESLICESLILPLIRNVLHWDTSDPSEFRPQEQRAGKRPDYIVYYQGMTQFIIEAKSAIKNLFEDEVALNQALEYGYNADKDFVILTNFKQIVILAPKIQYKNVQEAAIAKIDIIKASDEDLQTLLGFEREYWISSTKNNLLYQRMIHHKKSVPVDNRLLDDMKNWRQMLLQNIQKQNNKLNFSDDQDFAEIEKEVQKFIDRLVFICCCEDKRIHHEPTLKRLLNEKISHYSTNPGWLLDQIHGLFMKYRKVPDSDLFDASAADKYTIEDIKLAEVLTDLREPKGRPAYNFEEIDEDILGKVYENFIGHVQTGKRLKEKEDMGKRKKEGIYYTPKYIVEYIVNNTVREYIKGKSFDELLKVKILDPACGSGSFLLRAFNVLISEGAKALKRPLTYAEKKNLLLSCIYGVDLDERAVEITKLTFSLKLAQISEGLPVLANNIRHGNSLIDDETVAGEYLAFKWEDEFKEIMANSGFDVVIGNPPYGVDLKKEEQDFLYGLYNVGSTETAILFIKKSLDLLKKNGKMGFIVPKALCFASNYAKIRQILWDGFDSLIDCGKAWKEVKLEQVIFTASSSKKKEGYLSGVFEGSNFKDLGIVKKTDAAEFGFFLNNVSTADITLAKKIKANCIMLNNIASNQRGAILQKEINDTGTIEVIGGAQITMYGVVGIKGKIAKAKIQNEQAFIKDNSILVQRLVAHITKPTDHIKIIATVPKDNKQIIVDTINQLTLNKNYSPYFIWVLLQSKLVNWYVYRFIFGKAIRTMQFDNPTTSRIPIPQIKKEQMDIIVKKATELISLGEKLYKLSEENTISSSLSSKFKSIQQEMELLIYEAYNLNEKEKLLIETSFNQ